MSSLEPGNATILIVDDHEPNLELLSGILSAAGYRVVCAANGEQAISMVDNESVDLVLLDVVMPGRGGFSACVRIKANPKTRLIPVVLVTALSQTDDRIQGIMCGADDFLNKPVNKHELLARVYSLLRMKRFTDELDNAETVLFSLATSIEAKDPYTQGHCERLSEYSLALAERLNLAEELRVALCRGGIVHDLGKVVVPEHILLKRGPLTDEEWKVMKQHPIVGENICRPLKSFRLVLPIIRHHHERQDGSGYPDGLRGDEIPLTARVLQTVDIYDALTTDRPYRKALGPDEAIAQIRKEVERGWWDGSLVDALEALVSESTTLARVGGAPDER